MDGEHIADPRILAEERPWLTRATNYPLKLSLTTTRGFSPETLATIQILDLFFTFSGNIEATMLIPVLIVDGWKNHNWQITSDTDGKKLETIEVSQKPANVCYDGKDYKTLFTTARTSLYQVRLFDTGAMSLQKKDRLKFRSSLTNKTKT